MKQRTRAVLLLIFLAGLGGSIVSTELQRKAFAARNSSGTYSLPSSVNPVVSGTPITSTWGNTTMNDIATELTNSLDRAGRGSMTGALQLANGSAAAPGLSFASNPAYGLYWAGAGDMRMSAGSTDVEKYATAGVTFPAALVGAGTTTFNGATFFNGTPRINTNAFLDAGLVVGGPAQFDAGVTGIGVPAGGAGVVGQGGSTSGHGVVGTGGPSSIGVIGIGGTSSGTGGSFTGGSTNGIGLIATGTGSGVGAQIIGGLQIGSSGNQINTSIGAAYAGVSVTCASSGVIANAGTQTLTGAATTAVCTASVDAPDTNGHAACAISSSNTVQLYYHCANTFGATGKNFKVRVFQ